MTNENLLQTIDLIDEYALDTELDVLLSINESYCKMASLLEYGDDEAINEFDLFQSDNSIVMESNDDSEDKKKSGGICSKIKGWISNILKIIVNFFKKIFHIGSKNKDSEVLEDAPKEIHTDMVQKGVKELTTYKQLIGFEEEWTKERVRINSYMYQKGDIPKDHVKDAKKNEKNELWGYLLQKNFDKPIYKNNGENAFELRPWSEWCSTMEYYVLGGYGKMMQSMNTYNNPSNYGQFKDVHNDAKNQVRNNAFNKPGILLGGEKFIEKKADDMVGHYIKGIIKKQDDWKKICQKIQEQKWTKHITPQQFEDAINAFSKQPSFNKDGVLTLATKDDNSTLKVILNPSKLTIGIRTSKNKIVNISSMSSTFEKYAEVFDIVINSHKKDFTSTIKEFNSKFNKITNNEEKGTDLTINQFCDVLKNNNKTLTDIMSKMEQYQKKINDIETKVGNDAELKQQFSQMTHNSSVLTEQLTAFYNTCKIGKNAICIFKVYIAFLECVGSRGYVSYLNNAPSQLDRTFLIQFKKGKEWRNM